MLILSPHVGNRWKSIQRRFVKKNTTVSHGLVQYEVPTGQNHKRALRECLKIANKYAKKGELIVILDSDAFPVNSRWHIKTKDWLCKEKYEFVAIQRLECGRYYKKIPHPSFSAWLHGTPIKITWADSYMNPHIAGYTKRNWKKLHVSNKMDFHKRLYKIYGDMIYHHGAGSRDVSKEGMFKKGLTFGDLFWKNPEVFIKKLRGR